jgi:heme/copper-type cytochrome/quinol oxidase subunit 4
MPRLVLRPLLALVGAYHLALGAVMVLAPRTFFDDIATYGAYNDHYIRDVASFYLALGAVLLVAVARTSWQVPLLAFATVQYVLHVINHLWDVGDTDPGWIGPVNVVSLALIAVVLLWMLRGTRRPQAADN